MIEAYLIIENNVVTNNVVWDGNTQTWTPPEDSIALVQKTTPAMIWQLVEGETVWTLIEVMGVGDIGFTWNGSVLTTNESQPADYAEWLAAQPTREEQIAQLQAQLDALKI